MGKEQVLEVLKQGMGTEIWGKRFYDKCAAQITAEDGKKVFQSLVVEEVKHLDLLRGQYAAVSGAGKMVSVQEALALAAAVSPTGIFPEAVGALPEIISDAQALQVAMDFEQRGYQIYDKLAKQAGATDEGAVWAFLAKAEDKHYQYLAETREYLTTNGAWYFDAQEFPFFEG